MKKIGIISVFIILLGYTLFYIIYNNLVDSIFEADNNFKQNLNTKIVIDSDTVTVIDYSIWNETYKLSDGRDIHFNMLDSLKIK